MPRPSAARWLDIDAESHRSQGMVKPEPSGAGRRSHYDHARYADDSAPWQCSCPVDQPASIWSASAEGDVEQWSSGAASSTRSWQAIPAYGLRASAGADEVADAGEWPRRSQPRPGRLTPSAARARVVRFNVLLLIIGSDAEKMAAHVNGPLTGLSVIDGPPDPRLPDGRGGRLVELVAAAARRHGR